MTKVTYPWRAARSVRCCRSVPCCVGIRSIGSGGLTVGGGTAPGSSPCGAYVARIFSTTTKSSSAGCSTSRSSRSSRLPTSSPVTVIVDAPPPCPGSSFVSVTMPSKSTCGVGPKVTTITTRENGASGDDAPSGESKAGAGPVRPASRTSEKAERGVRVGHLPRRGRLAEVARRDEVEPVARGDPVHGKRGQRAGVGQRPAPQVAHLAHAARAVRHGSRRYLHPVVAASRHPSPHEVGDRGAGAGHAAGDGKDLLRHDVGEVEAVADVGYREVVVRQDLRADLHRRPQRREARV